MTDLRKRIGRGIAAVARAPGAKGAGNANKRVRVYTPANSVADLAAIIDPPR